MRFFRVNVSQSLANVLRIQKFTAPTWGHNGYAKMQYIKKGDWILLGDGMRLLAAIVEATCDSYIGYVEVLDKIKLVDEGLRTVDFKVIKEIPSGLQFIELQKIVPHIEKNPLLSMNFCVEIHPKKPDKSNHQPFKDAVDSIINGET